MMNRLSSRQALIRAASSEAVISMISVIYLDWGLKYGIYFVVYLIGFLIVNLLGILDTETFVWSRLRVSGTPP